MLRNGRRPTYTPRAVSCKDPQILPHSTPHPSSACVRDNPPIFLYVLSGRMYLFASPSVIAPLPPFPTLDPKDSTSDEGREGLWPKNGRIITALSDRSAVDWHVPRTFVEFSCCWAIQGISESSLLWHWATNRIVLAYVSRNIRMHAQLHGNTTAQRLCRSHEAHTHRPVDIRVP